MADQRLWQSLEEWEGAFTPGGTDGPVFAALPEMLLNRRDFLRLAGGGLATGALAACSGPPQEYIVPAVNMPPELTPGKPLFYASALSHQGYARGILVECHEGRPTKIEGNPLHPASLGATDAATQAAIRTLWDAHRSRTPLQDGQPATWDRFVAELTNQRLRHGRDHGAGLRILLEPTTSPSLLAQLAALQQTFPEAWFFHYLPVDDRNARAGAVLAFGEAVDVHARLAEADVIVALDCDFLGDHPDALRLAAEFAQRREPERNGGTMNRLYVVECAPSLTGAMADHRLALRSAEVHAAAAALAQALGATSSDNVPAPTPALRRLANDLRATRGRSVVLVGARQPPAVHALAHALNDHLGNVGKTIDYRAPVRSPADDLSRLVDDMAGGAVQTLLILGANPVYTAPVDLAFHTHLARVPFSVHLGLYQDETAQVCRWHVPQTHALETWGDLRAPDGSVTICQPMIAPLFGGHSERELLALLAGDANPAAYKLVRGYWEKTWGGVAAPDRTAPPRDNETGRVANPDAFTARWQKALQDGVIDGTAAPVKAMKWRGHAVAPPAVPESAIELNFLPDPTVGDGRDASNPWLQELPKPLTKLTWDNALLVAPRTAERLGLAHTGFADVRLGERRLRAPVWITPGHGEDAVSLHLGYGRQAGSPVALGHGVNAYALRLHAPPDFVSGVEVSAAAGRYAFASGQGHDRMEGRDLVRRATLADYRRNPHFARYDATLEQGSGFFEPFPYTGYKWAMSVNLNTCTGCSACVVACQAENNIPSVGKDEVRKGRKMHWLRIDRYYLGDPAAPRTLFQPVPCMQCENAPCEPVCPVAASIHDDEGINVQVYNRCIGTRFCSNNCPYKVRRFNFLQYAQDEQVANHQRNPDVTVRMRGVMEKCNYCLQRIAAARIAAELAGRPLRDGEVVTACQAVCPSRAIVFGDLNDPHSAVNAQKSLPRSYALLAELHTKPRTTYLAKLENSAPGSEA